MLQNLHLTGGHNTLTFAAQASCDTNRDLSVGNVHWNVPRSSNTLFTGRDALLERIKSAIQNDTLEQSVFVITGLGGLGKSEVCLRIAHEMRQMYVALSSYFRR